MLNGMQTKWATVQQRSRSMARPRFLRSGRASTSGLPTRLTSASAFRTGRMRSVARCSAFRSKLRKTVSPLASQRERPCVSLQALRFHADRFGSPVPLTAVVKHAVVSLVRCAVNRFVCTHGQDCLDRPMYRYGHLDDRANAHPRCGQIFVRTTTMTTQTKASQKWGKTLDRVGTTNRSTAGQILVNGAGTAMQQRLVRREHKARRRLTMHWPSPTSENIQETSRKNEEH